MSMLKILFTKYPLVRGMVSYSLIWPTSALIQQTIAGKTWENYDWKKCVRFSLYGGLVVAPTLYCWIKIASTLWPTTSFKTAVYKAIVETFSYTPFAMTAFYFGMSILENKTIDEATNEVKTKFWPTYKVAVCVWPLVAMVNFSLIPERNRVPFISICSLLWTCFLAYMKQLEMMREREQEARSHQ
ncbi:mpv17-like protein [Bradysia coprophila]|uniref:mpv17-like protein n=1 Tax=Bradysia coprophila TaxID=38358 RepID=UPI00187D8AF4|nr:mpv17-like protein [Bradysia coprophila]XP_037048579.1 mpv17-like protein [Bradysia coprophila]XP_037048587.1 mpv17-like protein [Bradysia coprophila]XP_037048594.1 mpv17-like protein [Bradysia coprophila]